MANAHAWKARFSKKRAGKREFDSIRSCELPADSVCPLDFWVRVPVPALLVFFCQRRKLAGEVPGRQLLGFTVVQVAGAVGLPVLVKDYTV